MSFRPPAPVPRLQTPRSIDLIRTLWRNPIEAWTQAHFEEPVVKTRLPFCDVVVVNSASAVRRVLSDNAENYCKDHFQKRMLAVLSHGLLTAEGPQWRFQRKLMTPLFRPASVKGMARAMAGVVDDLVKHWSARDGSVIDIAEETTELALEVLAATIFSAELTKRNLRPAMRMYFEALGQIDPFDLLDLPDFIPRISRLRASPAIRLLHRAIDDMIAAREQTLEEDRAATTHDILLLLIRARDPKTGQRLTGREVRANILTFMAAGHESTANAITWTLYLLSRSLEWHERVRAEADRETNTPPESLFDRLTVTRAVVEESLRLYPPLAAISRMARNDDELAGIHVKAGTLIVVSPYVLHRHRSWGLGADQFDPRRFLPGSREQINRYAYLPFGAGSRGCIGSIFALQEATLAVAAITRNFELTLRPDHIVWPVHRITLRPGSGLPMLVHRRVSDRRESIARKRHYA
jgi:cytochrome P450